MKTGNILNLIPKTVPKEIFEEIVSTEHVRIERIISKGHRSPDKGWYDQERSEWVMVVKGAAEILFDSGEKVKLSSGDYVQIPAGKKHRVTWTLPDDETVWLAVHY